MDKKNKKRILIVNNNMRIGGVQKSLVNLLHAIHDKYSVTLLLFSKTGEYLKEIPEDVKVITVTSHYKYFGITSGEAKNNIFSFVLRSFYAVVTRVLGRKYAVGLMNLTQKKLSGYDVAIAFLHNAKNKSFYGGCSDFVLHCVNAEKKVVYLHCDYVKSGANTPENVEHYSKFDVVAACSDGCRSVFVNALPKLESKTVTVVNCHDFAFIKESAEKSPQLMDSDYINIVTVARLSGEKGVLRAVKAISSLKDERRKVRYYIIGDGTRRSEIEAKIREDNLADIVIMCGSLENPYGYMAAADMLLIPSYEEAAPMVIDEAASLGTPVLSTLTSSAEDMIQHRGLGWVCENSQEGIAEKLKKLISDPSVIYEHKRSLNDMVFDNSEAIKQFNDMIG